MEEIKALKRLLARVDRTRAVEVEKIILEEVVSPLLGTVDVGKRLGWRKQKVSVYHQRGKLPKPVGYVGGRPMWTERQIDIYKLTSEGE